MNGSRSDAPTARYQLKGSYRPTRLQDPCAVAAQVARRFGGSWDPVRRGAGAGVIGLLLRRGIGSRGGRGVLFVVNENVGTIGGNGTPARFQSGATDPLCSRRTCCSIPAGASTGPGCRPVVTGVLSRYLNPLRGYSAPPNRAGDGRSGVQLRHLARASSASVDERSALAALLRPHRLQGCRRRVAMALGSQRNVRRLLDLFAPPPAEADGVRGRVSIDPARKVVRSSSRPPVGATCRQVGGVAACELSQTVGHERRE
jgi:hypothetical protein